MTGEMVGRSSAEQNVVNLIDKLGAGGKFTELTCRLDPRTAGGARQKALGHRADYWIDPNGGNHLDGSIWSLGTAWPYTLFRPVPRDMRSTDATA